MTEDRRSSTLTVRLETLEPPTLQLLKTVSDRVEGMLHELTARDEPTKLIANWLVRRVEVGSLAIEVEANQFVDRSVPRR
jgi:hypothetical protein